MFDYALKNDIANQVLEKISNSDYEKTVKKLVEKLTKIKNFKYFIEKFGFNIKKFQDSVVVDVPECFNNEELVKFNQMSSSFEKEIGYMDFIKSICLKEKNEYLRIISLLI